MVQQLQFWRIMPLITISSILAKTFLPCPLSAFMQLHPGNSHHKVQLLSITFILLNYTKMLFITDCNKTTLWSVMIHTEPCLIPPLLELVRALWNYTHTFVASLHCVQLNRIGEGIILNWTDPGWSALTPDPGEGNQREVHVCVEGLSMSHVSEKTCTAFLCQLTGRRAQSVISIANSRALSGTTHVRSVKEQVRCLLQTCLAQEAGEVTPANCSLKVLQQKVLEM